MRVSKAEIRNLRPSGIDIKISNGMRDFMLSIDKNKLSYNDIINYTDNMNIKVYSMVRNCCAACPVVVLEKDKNEKDDNELKDVIEKIVNIIGNELQEKLL